MSTLLCAETNAVVKLDLGAKGGTRRIVFSRLWDSETSQASFGRLTRLAFKHSTIHRPELHRAIITYTDVDGDTITISTHHELTEAFEQFVTHPLNTGVTPVVLRAQVSFVKERGVNNNGAMQKKMEEDNLEACSKTDSDSGGKKGKKGMRWVQLQLVLDSLVTNMTKAVEKLSKDVEGMGPRKIDGVTTAGIGKPETIIKADEPLGRGDKRMNRKRGGKGMKWVQLQFVLDSFMTNMTDIVGSLSKDVEGMRVLTSNIAEVTEIGIAEAKEIGIAEAKEIGIAEAKEIGITQAKEIGITQAKEIGKLENAWVANNCGGNESPNEVSDSNVAVSGGVGWEVVS